MGTAAYILGGALQGLGGGMAAQAQVNAKAQADDVAARRDIALENLRNQNAIGRDAAQSTNRQTEMKQEYGLRDLNASRDAVRDVSKAVTLKGIDFKNDVAMAKVKASLDRSNDAAAQTLKASIEAGQVTDIKEGSDGNLYAVYKDGRTANTNVKFAPKASDGQGASLTGGRSGTAQVPYKEGSQPKTLKFDANGNIIG